MSDLESRVERIEEGLGIGEKPLEAEDFVHSNDTVEGDRVYLYADLLSATQGRRLRDSDYRIVRVDTDGDRGVYIEVTRE